MQFNDTDFLKLISPKIDGYKEKLRAAYNPDELIDVHGNIIIHEREVSHLKYLMLKSDIDIMKKEFEILREEVHTLKSSDKERAMSF